MPEQQTGQHNRQREDGRLPTTAAFVQHLLREPPALAFRPDFTPPQFRAWREKVRRKLRHLLAFPRTPAQPAPRMLAEEPRDGYRLQRWELYPEPRCVVPFLMLVPDGSSADSPAPAVLCLPGSEQPKEALCGEPWDSDWKNRFGEHNFMALHFVRAGFVAIAFDNPSTAELFDEQRPEWKRQSLQLIWLGRTYEGLSTFQKLAALPWLKSLPFVDESRIATCGHSLGAKPALLSAVLDKTIRAVVWNDMASDWRERDVATNLEPVAPWHYIPSFARWFDYMDLMCALAPRPLLITEGGRPADHARIRAAYQIHGKADRLRITFMPNFRDPARRCSDPLPEGIDAKAYAKYANYDGDHYFKEDVAVPWLCEVFAWRRKAGDR